MNLNKTDFESLSFNKAQVLYLTACKSKNCLWCNKSFETLVKKEPETIKEYSAINWFTPEYLVHVQTTHGYSPEDIDSFISSLKNQKHEENNN